MELVAPAELVTGLAEGVVADLGAGVSLGEVGGVGGNLVGDDAGAHILPIGQSEVLLGRHVAEHRRAEPANLRGPDGAGDVVVAGRDVGDQRSERVERGVVAGLDLALHILLDLVQGHVSGTFDEGLHILGPGASDQFAQSVEFGELGLVIGVGNAAGAQTVAE